jgi:hypothetical protein
VTDGGIATHAVVLAKEGSGASLVLVDLSGTGVTRKALSTLDPTRGHAELTFDKTPGIRLGKAGEGASLNDAADGQGRRAARLRTAGRGLPRAGNGEGIFAMERYAFGRPIAGNQAIKHKLAEMYVKTKWRARTASTAPGPCRPMRRKCRKPLPPPAWPRRKLSGMLEREHPDPWRHGLHLGGGLPPLLPPRQAAGRSGWRTEGLERETRACALSKKRRLRRKHHGLQRYTRRSRFPR